MRSCPFVNRLTTYIPWLIYDERSDNSFYKILPERYNQKRLLDSSMFVKRSSISDRFIIGSTPFKSLMATRSLIATELQLAHLHLQLEVLTLRLPRRMVSTRCCSGVPIQGA